MDDSDELRISNLREFLFNISPFLPEWFHPKSTICRCVSPTDWRLQITLALRASGGSNSPHSLSLEVITPKFDDISTHVLSLRSMIHKDSVTPWISKRTHDYTPSNFSRFDGHDLANTDGFIDRWFKVIARPQHAHSLSGSSTSTIWKYSPKSV